MTRLSSELVLQLTDKVSGPARGVGSALDRLDHKQRAMASNMRQNSRLASQMGATMGRAGAAALASVGAVVTPAAIAYGAQKAVSVAADFESALTGIQKKAGTTAEQTAALGAEIKALAGSGTLAVPIEEIAAAFERGAAAGIPVAELKEFAALSVKAADGFDMGAEEVGNFAAKLKTSLGMSAKEVKQVFDLTNSLADAGIADESSIVNFMDRAGASLKTLGLAKEETLALGSTLLNIGMPAEVASTGMGALSGKLLTVGKLTGKGKKTFEKYMGSVGGFAKLLDRDANGALLKMLDTLNGLTKTQKMDFLSSFVGAEWSDEMLRLVEATDEYRRNLALARDEAKWNGSLDLAYNLKLDDFWSKWQTFKNNLQAASIDLGDYIISPAGNVLDGISNFFEAQSAIRKGIQKQEEQGGSEDEAWTEYARRYQDVNGDRLWGRNNTEIVEAFKRDMARYGRGQISNPYADLDWVADARSTKRFPSAADAEAASAAHRERNSGNLDGEDVGKGTPTPAKRPIRASEMTPEQQRQEAGRGRMKGEAAVRLEQGQGGWVGEIDRSYARIQSGLARVSREFEDAAPVRRAAEIEQLDRERSAVQSRLARENAAKAGATGRLPLMADQRISRLEGQLQDLSSRRNELRPAAPATRPSLAADLAQLRTPPAAPVVLPAMAPPATVPQPARVTVPVEADTSAAQAEIERLETQIADLSTLALDIGQAANIAPNGDAAGQMRELNDQMATLMARRAELEASLWAPVIAPPAVGPEIPNVPIPTPRPDIAGPVREEGERARAEAAFQGEQIKAALSVTARPTVDNSALQGTLAIAQAINRELGRTSGLARQAAAAAGEARAAHSAGPTFDGLHADIED